MLRALHIFPLISCLALSGTLRIAGLIRILAAIGQRTIDIAASSLPFTIIRSQEFPKISHRLLRISEIINQTLSSRLMEL